MGMASGGGDVSFVSINQIENLHKVGVVHEIGHNLGCGHESGYCPENFGEFSQAVGKRYQTIMGGGGACEKSDEIENIRLKLFTDPNKEYCENDVCYKLGNEDYNCVKKMISNLEKDVARLEVRTCPEMDARGYCLYAPETKCTDAVEVGKFEDLHSCVDYLLSD